MTFLEMVSFAVNGRSEVAFIDTLLEFVGENQDNSRVFQDIYELLMARERYMAGRPEAVARERCSIYKMMDIIIDPCSRITDIKRELVVRREKAREEARRYFWEDPSCFEMVAD